MSTQPKVLVVDADESVRGLISCAFEGNGYNVISACSGEEGINLFRDDSYDIVLTNLHIPNKSGRELVKEIQKRNPEQLILMFANKSDALYELESQAKELGVFNCFSKPFDIDKLMFAVEMVFATREEDALKLDFSSDIKVPTPIFSAKQEENNGENKKGKILILDDEQGVRDLLSYELKMQGYEIATAENGLVALEILKKEKYDLVISDIKMPKISGVQTLEKIKEIDPNIEVIMATGYATTETAVQSMKKGAYDYIQKPFNMKEVLVLIEKALEKHEINVLIGIYEASQVMFKTLDLNQLLKIIVGILRKTLRADEVLVFLDKEDKGFDIVASEGVHDLITINERKEMCRKAYLNMEKDTSPVLYSHDLLKNKGEEEVNNNEIKSSLICVLSNVNKKNGLICLNRISMSNAFSTQDIKTSSIFVSLMNQAIENAWLYTTLKDKIDELKNAHEKLELQQIQVIEREKLSSIGRLVRGVAHEVNNPLTVIMGTLELLLDSPGNIQDAKLENRLRTVYGQADVCRRIIQNLLLFARRRTPVKGFVNIQDIIDEVLELLNYEIIETSVSVEKRIMKDMPSVFVDFDQIRQVFLNIMNNAIFFIEATERDGELVIDIRQENDTLIVRIQDNGIGMTPEEVKKIFDPFFTTKEVKQGTGLGMSLCYGIMQEHGGSIHVESKKGEGSTVILQFKIK